MTTTTSSQNETCALLCAARAQDDRAWGRLFDRYDERLRRLAGLLLGARLRDAHDPDDLIAETWRRVLPLVEDFRYEKKDAFFGLLAMQCRRIAAEWGRKGGEARRQFQARGRVELDGAMVDEQPGLITLIHRSDVSDRVRSAIADDRMPAIYRDVLNALLIEQQDRAEYALARGRKPDTVKKQFLRGLQRLRDIVGDLEP